MTFLPVVILLAALIAGTPALAGPEEQTVAWSGLERMIVGRTIQVVLPNGEILKGKGLRVNAEALLIGIKGQPRPVARADVSTVMIHRKGVVWRVVGTAAGFVGGAASGVAIALNCLFCPRSTLRDTAAVGIILAGPVAGYLIGNRADRKTQVVAIRREP